MTKPKGTNRKKVRVFCFAHYQKSERSCPDAKRRIGKIETAAT